MTQILNCEFSPKQIPFLLNPFHYSALVAGIGFGKSYVGCYRGLMASQGWIGDQKLIPTPNVGMITAPTYPMLRDATLRTFLEIAGGAVIDFNKSEMLATLVNGSQVLFRSADNPERLRGPNLSWWMGDEAALYESLVWRIMLGRLRQFGRRGWAWLTTTPKGRNWIWSEFAQRRRTAYQLFRARTKDNVFLDREFIADLEEAYTGDFAAQELLGEFIAFEGLIYPEFDPLVHRTTQPIPLDRLHSIRAGVDWGFTNPGVILIGGRDSDGRVHIIHEEYQRRRRIEEWVNVARELRDLYSVESFYCDPSEPDYIDAFNDANLTAYKADNSVSSGIQAVRNLLVVRKDGKPRLTVHSSAANALKEFEQYQWLERRESGSVEKLIQDKPMKVNDHAMDALRYLIKSFEAPEVTISVGVNKVA